VCERRPIGTLAAARRGVGMALIGWLFVGVAAWAPSALAAEAGDLDTSFDSDGRVVTDLGAFDVANGVAIQPDGRIVAAGGRGTMSSSDFALARYNPDGSLDPSFAGDGTIETGFGGEPSAANAVAIQPDGKIVAAGETDFGDGRFALARYNPDGSPDTDFAGDGRVLTDIGGGDDGANAVAIQPDGKIVAAGNTAFGGGNFGLARYNPDGSLDTTFAGNGKLEVGFGGNEAANAVAIQADDGKIVVAGESDLDDGGYALVRLSSDGSLDPSFDGEGKVFTQFNGGANALAIQADRKIVAAGLAGNADADFSLARYNPDGSLDSSFSGNGLLVTDFGANDGANAVAIQADGKIIAAGETELDTGDFALARYNPDGDLDPTFGDDGRVVTDLGAFDVATGVAIQPDGRIVAAGVRSTMGDSDFALARYHAEAVEDTPPQTPPDSAPPGQGGEPDPNADPAPDTEGTIRIKGKKLRFNKKRIARARLACPASEASPPCSGRLTLKTQRKVRFKGKERRIALARSKRFEIGAGETERVRLKLSKPKRKLVRRNKAARRARAIAKVRDRATVRKKLRVRAR
jgi:uncharacterized delta-60 repeat protein